MSIWLVTFVTICYALVGAEQLYHGNTWFGIMWSAYAIANVALVKAGGTGAIS